MPEHLPVIVGENNPYGDDSYFAMYPEPEGSAGWRFCRLILGLKPAAYLRLFDRRNLLTGRTWSAPRAREAAKALRLEIGPATTAILLGRKVAAAFGLEQHPPFTRLYTYVLLPHPSGLCREWNAPGSFKRARDLLHAAGITVHP